MKKLEKLSLKELEAVATVIDGKGLVGGGSDSDPHEGAGPVLGYGGYMLPEFTCSGKDALYGNYLGPGVNAAPQTLGQAPINQLDSACYKHDQAYYELGANGVSGALFDTRTAFADAQLAIEALQAATNGNNDVAQRVWAMGTTVVFSVISTVKMIEITP